MDFDYPVPPPPPSIAPASARDRRALLNNPSLIVMDTQTALAGTDGDLNATALTQARPAGNEDASSDHGSGDSLFGDEPEGNGEPDTGGKQRAANPSSLLNPSVAKPSAGPPPSRAIRMADPAPVPRNAPPILDPVSYAQFSSDIFMTAAIDGQIILWDARVPEGIPGRGVGRLWMGAGTPPWCLSVRPPLRIRLKNARSKPVSGLLVNEWDAGLCGEAQWRYRHMGCPASWPLWAIREAPSSEDLAEPGELGRGQLPCRVS
jgi:hypothetical protein